MNPRYFGHVQDIPDARDWSFSDLLAMRPAIVTGSVDYSDRLDAVQNQLGGSCVGQSIASAAFLTAAIAGTPIGRPSALFPYSIARLLDAPNMGLVDIGCRPRTAMLGIRERGLIAIDRWPETSDNLNAVPPLDAFQAGEDATLDAFYRIDDAGDVREGLRHALARGYCPLFGMSVDTAYEGIGSRIYIEPSGSVLGNHAQVVVGYHEPTDAFRVLNSWGTTFGSGGFSWIASSFMSTRTFDRWVIQVTPEAVR
jgi:hypothetical protein